MDMWERYNNDSDIINKLYNKINKKIIKKFIVKYICM